MEKTKERAMSEPTVGHKAQIWPLVLAPAVITLGVTLVRLLGEVMNLSQRFFTRSAGGAGAIVGIVWLVPVFGVYFAIKLVSMGQRPAGALRAVLIMLAALLVIPATGFLASALDLQPVGMIMTFGVGSLVAAWVAYQAWPALGATLIAYGLAARIPVALVMLVAIFNNWGTHYELGPPNLPPMGALTKWVVIGLVPQLTLWMGFTASVGGLFGAVAAAIAVRRTAARPASVPATS
jgi:hypothetical protein